MRARPLFDAWPRLDLPWEPLGDFPTPVESLEPVVRAAGLATADAWVKRDDVSSPVYGGNKVRTLEALFGEARAMGATHVYSTGAFGSNHAVATVLHAPRVGMAPGALLFPQPPSETAFENLRVMIGRSELRPLPHFTFLPFGMSRTRRDHERRGERAYVMVPGGATPLGGFGYVSAALELAQQIEAGELPAPRVVVVGVGSTCTSAGLLVGFHHAARLGIGFRDGPPKLVSVRVTPWPITSPIRIARLAVRVSELLAERAGDASLALPYAALRAPLEVDRRELGWGYGRPTRRGRDALAHFRARPGFELDTTYSAKAAAGFLRFAARTDAPLLFWSTKSTVPLPAPDQGALAAAPAALRRWLARRPL